MVREVARGNARDAVCVSVGGGGWCSMGIAWAARAPATAARVRSRGGLFGRMDGGSMDMAAAAAAAMAERTIAIAPPPGRELVARAADAATVAASGDAEMLAARIAAWAAAARAGVGGAAGSRTEAAEAGGGGAARGVLVGSWAAAARSCAEMRSVGGADWWGSRRVVVRLEVLGGHARFELVADDFATCAYERHPYSYGTILV